MNINFHFDYQNNEFAKPIPKKSKGEQKNRVHLISNYNPLSSKMYDRFAIAAESKNAASLNVFEKKYNFVVKGPDSANKTDVFYKINKASFCKRFDVSESEMKALLKSQKNGIVDEKKFKELIERKFKEITEPEIDKHLAQIKLFAENIKYESNPKLAHKPIATLNQFVTYFQKKIPVNEHQTVINKLFDEENSARYLFNQLAASQSINSHKEVFSNIFSILNKKYQNDSSSSKPNSFVKWWENVLAARQVKE